MAQAVDSMALARRVAWSGAEVLTQLREADGVRYLYLYNPTNNAVSFSPAIEGAGAVFDLSPWIHETSRRCMSLPMARIAAPWG
jgi:hypothetical protein